MFFSTLFCLLSSLVWLAASKQSGGPSAAVLSSFAVNCSNAASALTYGKVLWVDERVAASEALLFGRAPCVVLRPVLGGAWLQRNDTAERRAQLLQWLVLQRDALLAAHPAVAAAVWGGCWKAVDSALTVLELTQRWPDVVADARLPAAPRVRVALNALEFVHYLNVFPRLADRDAALADRQDQLDDGDDGDDDESAHLADVSGGDTVVLGSVAPELFSVSGDYFVKLSLVKNVHVYRGHAYGADVKCKVDHDCRKFFFTQKRMLESLHDDAPDDFNCNLATNRCYGLDWRTNLYAVCRELLAPLFGVTRDGNVAPPSSRPPPPPLPYPIRNSAANALRDCLSPEPKKRPFPRDLQNELAALTDAALPPFFTPRNDAARTAARLADVFGNVTALGDLLADVQLDAHAVAQNRFRPPTELTDWAFLFAAGVRDNVLTSPPVVLIGTRDGQPWMSSSIATRDSPHTLRTHSGTTYRLNGAPACQRFERVKLSGALCLKLHDGLPGNWRELFDAEWQRIFADAAEQHWKATADAAPDRFALATVHDSFQPPPTPQPTILFRLIPTSAPAAKPAKTKTPPPLTPPPPPPKTPKTPPPPPPPIFESESDDASSSLVPALAWGDGKSKQNSILFLNRPPALFAGAAEPLVDDDVLPPVASVIVGGKQFDLVAPEAPAVQQPPQTPSPPVQAAAAQPANAPIVHCLDSNGTQQMINLPFGPTGSRFRLTVQLRRKPAPSEQVLIAASFLPQASLHSFSTGVVIKSDVFDLLRLGPTGGQVTPRPLRADVPHKYQLHIMCTLAICDVMLMSFDTDPVSHSQQIATLALAADVPVFLSQPVAGGLRVLAVQQIGGGSPGIANVCIDDIRLQ